MTLLVLLISTFIVLIDQLIKIFVYNNLKPIGTVNILGNIIMLTYTENKGAAFSILKNCRWLFIAATLIIICLFIYVVAAKKIKNKLFLISSSLVIGGGVGNLIDRLFRGYVIDYINVSFFPAICNFADYCITIGTVLLVIYNVFSA